MLNFGLYQAEQLVSVILAGGALFLLPTDYFNLSSLYPKVYRSGNVDENV